MTEEDPGGDAVTLESVAEDLYSRPPEEFVEVRTQYVDQAKADGDRALARAVAALRRPTQAAWIANLLARERRSDLEALLALGAQLREAQSALQGDELRRLLEQRRGVVTALVREARRLAAAVDRPVGESVGWELEATLEQALADETVADHVRTGRLLAGVKPGEAAVSMPLDAPEPAPKRAAAGASKRAAKTSTTRAAPSAATPDDLAARRAAREAERVAAEARRRREEAQRALDAAAEVLTERQEELTAAESDLETLRTQREQARQAVAEAERVLTAARVHLAGVEEGAAAADRRRAEAAEAVVAAQSRVEDAQEALDSS